MSKKSCEYCENTKENKPLINEEKENIHEHNYLFACIYNDKLFVEDNTFGIEIQANYCLVCGRKLEEEQNENRNMDYF